MKGYINQMDRKRFDPSARIQCKVEWSDLFIALQIGNPM